MLDPPLEASPEEVREALAPLRHDFSIALTSPGNAFAIGAVIRTAHSFLAREIFVIGGDTWYPKGSMGMEKYEHIVRLPDEAAFCEAIGDRPLFALEREHARRSVVAVDAFPRGVVLLFGSERFGIPRPLLDRATDVLAVPMYGVNQSFPVTVAAGIAMHEWARRHAHKHVVGTGDGTKSAEP